MTPRYSLSFQRSDGSPSTSHITPSQEQRGTHPPMLPVCSLLSCPSTLTLSKGPNQGTVPPTFGVSGPPSSNNQDSSLPHSHPQTNLIKTITQLRVSSLVMLSMASWYLKVTTVGQKRIYQDQKQRKRMYWNTSQKCSEWYPSEAQATRKGKEFFQGS